MSLVTRSWVGACVLVPLLLSSGVAAADEESGARDEDRPKPNERVCRNVRVTGSHLPQRVCMKQRKWDQLREDAQRAMREADPSTNGSDSG